VTELHLRDRHRRDWHSLHDSDELAEASRRIREQAATIRRLQQALAVSIARAELLEAAARRAYGFAAAAGSRR